MSLTVFSKSERLASSTGEWVYRAGKAMGSDLGPCTSIAAASVPPPVNTTWTGISFFSAIALTSAVNAGPAAYSRGAHGPVARRLPPARRGVNREAVLGLEFMADELRPPEAAFLLHGKGEMDLLPELQGREVFHRFDLNRAARPVVEAAG